MPSVNILLKSDTITTDVLLWITYGVASCCPQVLFNDVENSLLQKNIFSIILQNCKSSYKYHFHGCSSKLRKSNLLLHHTMFCIYSSILYD